MPSITLCEAAQLLVHANRRASLVEQRSLVTQTPSSGTLAHWQYRIHRHRRTDTLTETRTPTSWHTSHARVHQCRTAHHEIQAHWHTSGRTTHTGTCVPTHSHTFTGPQSHLTSDAQALVSRDTWRLANTQTSMPSHGIIRGSNGSSCQVTICPRDHQAKGTRAQTRAQRGHTHSHVLAKRHMAPGQHAD